MNSYQKLKEKNKELIQDIYKIINQDDETICRYIMKKNMSDILMFGSPLVQNKLNSDYIGLVNTLDKIETLN
ncbi:MAG: hypothetical protein ABI091_26685 [Ferruginibacter sp.]